MCFKTKATLYGLEHENIARQEYISRMKTLHKNLTVALTGLIVSTQESILAATPDGLIHCDCCGDGCLEIKCPYTMLDKSVNIKQFAALKNSCLISKNNNEYGLDKKHAYYFQVQLQMYVTETNYTDFMVWSKKDILIERIYFDKIFVESNICKAKKLHSNVIVPELLVRWYTLSKDSVQPELWCECRGPDDEREMIRCANEDCPIQLFHLQCLKLQEFSANTFWFCKICSKNVFGSMV